ACPGHPAEAVRAPGPALPVAGGGSGDPQRPGRCNLSGRRGRALLPVLHNTRARLPEAGAAPRADGPPGRARAPPPAGEGRAPHTFRHTTAMHLLQAGVDITVIALWLGHESTETTHQYVEADLAMKDRAMSKVEEIPVKRVRYRPGEKLLQFLDEL